MANVLGKMFAQNQSAAFIKDATKGVVALATTHSDAFEKLSKEELQARIQVV
jgi:hypothetical protein